MIETELLRAGRTASRVRARMSQDGRACVEALVTVSQVDEATVPHWERRLPEISRVGYDECVPLVPRTPDGMRVPMMEQIEVRLEPTSAGFTTGHPSGRGELRGWLALPDREAFDASSLLFAIDAHPPPPSISNTPAGCRPWNSPSMCALGPRQVQCAFCSARN